MSEPTGFYSAPTPYAVFRLTIAGCVLGFIIVWFVAAVHLERVAEHPFDAATEVFIELHAFSDTKPHPEPYYRFGNVDWIACEVLQPYPTRVCTARDTKPHPEPYYRFGNVDWIACEVLQPYPTRVCTARTIRRMTHLVICEKNIIEIPDGWLGGDGTMVRRIER